MIDLCPVTFEVLGEDRVGRYSPRGLHRLARALRRLDDLPEGAAELRARAAARPATVPGASPKLLARLRVKEGRFDVAGGDGTFLLKPPPEGGAAVPENENVTMHLAALAGIEVPVHGLVRAADGTWTYFVRRFDRVGHGRAVGVEHLGQVLARVSATLGAGSGRACMEDVAAALDEHATFPVVEKVAWFRRVAFSFLVGHGDLAIEDVSLVVRGHRVGLAPAYDLVNTAIVGSPTREEVGLPVRGRTQRISRADLVDYYGRERLGLPWSVVGRVLTGFTDVLPAWERAIAISFLPPHLKKAYLDVVRARRVRLGV